MPKKCKETIPELTACKLPEIDIKEHRKKVKAYVAAFNVAIKKAIANDHLLLLIQLNSDFDCNWKNEMVYHHSIKFTDTKHLKI